MAIKHLKVEAPAPGSTATASAIDQTATAEPSVSQPDAPDSLDHDLYRLMFQIRATSALLDTFTDGMHEISETLVGVSYMLSAMDEHCEKLALRAIDMADAARMSKS